MPLRFKKLLLIALSGSLLSLVALRPGTATQQARIE